MNLIEDLQHMAQSQRESYERDNGKLPDDFRFTAERAKAEIERLTAQVEGMREVEKEIILRLQWAHCTTYHKDMEALFREILAAENPLQHLKELTFAFTALSYRGGD